MRIVIVEDEIKIREGMAKLIESQTEHVVLGKAVDGKDGLEMILRFKPDLVITDIRMPKMDGLEMVKELHERKLSLHVVILTGYSEFEYAQKALRYGVDDYLLKPLAIDDIRDMLVKVEKKIKKEQMTNGTPGQHVRNLIDGDEKDAGNHCSILKELCGFPSEGDYELFVGYIGSAELSYRDVLEHFVEHVREKHQEFSLYYFYVENQQRAYLLRYGGYGQGKMAVLEELISRRLILRYQGKAERAVWTKKCLNSPEQIRDAAAELDSLLAYALVLKPEGWLDMELAGQYCPNPYQAPSQIFSAIRIAICQNDVQKLEKEAEEFLSYMAEGHFETGEVRKAFVKCYYLIGDTLQEIDSSLYRHLKSRNLLRNNDGNAGKTGGH